MGVLNGFNKVHLRKVGALCQNLTCRRFIDRESLSFLCVLPLTSDEPLVAEQGGIFKLEREVSCRGHIGSLLLFSLNKKKKKKEGNEMGGNK